MIASLSLADSTSPRLAAYYENRMLLCGDTAYQWQGTDQPKSIARNVLQVGVGRDAFYTLSKQGNLMAWTRGQANARRLMTKVRWFAAGRSGLFAAKADGTLFYIDRPTKWFSEGDVAKPVVIAQNAIAASIGDSANYYVKKNGRLFVKGLAHRGQYGDGKLQETDHFISVAQDVRSVKAHTGHALHLTEDGRVMGTGGNIYGPVGRHGIGDKAITWGEIFKGATAIATGSSHSLALRADGSLWHWGRNIGLDPSQILTQVTAAAADQSTSLALRKDNTLWQWPRDGNPKLHFKCP